MDDVTFLIIGISLICGALSVISGLALVRLWARGRQLATQASTNDASKRQTPTIFLFKGTDLLDATEPARHWLGRSGMPGTEWQQVRNWIESHFPQARGFAAGGGFTPTDLTARINPDGDEIRLVIENPGENLTRVTLAPANPGSCGDNDIMSRYAMEDELLVLRQAFDNAPSLLWRQDPAGRITWANASYLSQVRRITGKEPGWPMLHLFDLPDNGDGICRAKLISGDETLWFDCRRHNVGQDTMFFAVPADAAVRAERFLREFVQTLTRTFATLNTGFAIFDRQRNLQLFNPAIIELTGIRADFLASRPTLADFLDQLRELRMVPEPKDYPGWRRQINNLESAAASGHHLEEWSLPCGRVFRVQGSPHPDGAIALLFEDITSEIVIRREYREKLALNKAVLDQIDDSLAVFGPDGKLVLSNRSYQDNWSDEVSAAHDALRRSFLNPDIEPDECGGSISGPAGQRIGWSISQVSGGCRMLRFHAA
ncbi:PAS-domain containing protein [Paracoccus onubensis]|uniref:PAS domain-containing protein n=1 Tax=Paracoccus onubensis TaxID=1675788 RepID=A0A418SRA2_9RHOB|nr:PAS-domain containing protein [Paracoccus onubensis]RJE83503.1 PAS domain-containing protein [Paracoccus onubensis]